MTHFIEGGKLKIQAGYRTLHVSDSAIQERDGEYFYDVSKECLGFGMTFKEIHIPKEIIERKREAELECQQLETSFASFEYKGKGVYFFIDEQGNLITRHREKESITEGLITVEGKLCVEGYKLGVDAFDVEVPEEVVVKVKAAQDMVKTQNLCLVYAGTGPLTGKAYFKFDSSVPLAAWKQVEKYFSEFNESGDFWELKGWLTCEPTQVERILDLKNAIDSREVEIKKQIEKAQKKQEGIKIKLIKGQ